MEKDNKFQQILILLTIIMFLIMLNCIISIFICGKVYASDYKTPSWQQRAINNYNYNQAISNKSSTTIENDKDAPSWQRRAIDNYNYDKATNRQKEKRNRNDD